MKEKEWQIQKNEPPLKEAEFYMLSNEPQKIRQKMISPVKIALCLTRHLLARL